ncbi:MAG TPA: hypothetical protein VJA26_17775 [Gammaproteobacteria bacterium]|nr:hypothetical protein [Gammaproteobacteria bacterium]
MPIASAAEVRIAVFGPISRPALGTPRRFTVKLRRETPDPDGT